jgi:Amiloride-sensitive sodium channel
VSEISLFEQVYFTDLKYTIIEKSPSYTTLALWCDIGGALSLVLGGTLLTFVELMDVAAMLINRYLKIRQLRKISQVSSLTHGTILPSQ